MCGIETDFFLPSGSDLTFFFFIGIKIDFGFVCGPRCLRFNYRSQMTWFIAWGSKLTWFLCAVRKLLVFGVGIDWLSVCADGRNPLGFCILSENHVVLVWSSSFTSFSCGCSKMTWFQCGDRNPLGFGVGTEYGLVLVFGWNLTWFMWGIEIDLVWVYLSKWTWFWRRGIKIDLIL